MTARLSHCLQCGNALVQPVEGRPRKFCSSLCRGFHWIDDHLPEGMPPPCSCANCGLNLVQPAKGRKRRFCSTVCRLAYRYITERKKVG